MKQILVSSLLFCSLLAACTPTRRTVYHPAPFPRDTDPAMGSDGQLLYEQETPGDSGAPAPTPAPRPVATPVPTPQPKKRDAVYVIPEPGKPGFGRSPYSPQAGLIEYRGMPPGTEIKDPYTEGKNLLVP
ncbi:MAG: hypothetical protein PHQ12_12450 [Chthoniobacteraceae bacterium]|nr:hypothetical protein [Chthoniobacteraceae bacterium]